jgi:hypothetical protein
MIKATVSMVLLSLLCGCDDVQLPQTKQLNERVAALDKRVAALEAAAAQPPRETYILWESYWQLKNTFNGKPPTAEGAYSSKLECLGAAKAWPNNDGGTLISEDPVVFQSKVWNVTLRCLPKGVEPFTKK